MMKKLSPKSLYATITISSAIGFIASFLQMLEKLTLLKDPQAPLACNINAVFSCTNILDAWQSSVFGFPNALMCIIFFTVMMTAGLVGWTGGQVSYKLRLVLQAMALFFVGFGFWYLWQSIFVVGALCIYCMFCYGAVLVSSWAFLRMNHTEYGFNGKARKFINDAIAKDYDTVFWTAIAVIIIVEIIVKFA